MELKKNQSGLTIIEMLVIVVVISILAFLGWWAWSTAQQKNRDADRIATINETHAALVDYFRRETVMPASPESFDPVCQNDEGFLEELIISGDLDALPTDEVGKEYCYFDFGANNKTGAVIGIELEDTIVDNVCDFSEVEIDNWCGEGYYCLCQPYQLIETTVEQ